MESLNEGKNMTDEVPVTNQRNTSVPISAAFVVKVLVVFRFAK